MALFEINPISWEQFRKELEVHKSKFSPSTVNYWLTMFSFGNDGVRFSK